MDNPLNDKGIGTGIGKEECEKRSIVTVRKKRTYIQEVFIISFIYGYIEV